MASNKTHSKVLFEELLKSFRRKKAADVTLLAEGKEIRVSKFMLVTFSEYFETLFGSNWSAESRQHVVVSHFKHKTMLTLIQGLHAGRIDYTTVPMAVEIYKALDYYAIKRFLEDTLKFITNNMAQQNLITVLTMAEQLQLDVLVETVATYIVDHRLNHKKLPLYSTIRDKPIEQKLTAAMDKIKRQQPVRREWKSVKFTHL